MPRYIDAEKLLDQFLELCGGKSCLDCQFFEHGCNLELMILNQPIADVQPVRHGHWIEQDGYDGDTYYDCSVCGESWTTIEEDPWDNGMNYCPHCGAQMEVEQDD